MNTPLSLLSQSELLQKTSVLVQEERRITLELIEHLREIQTRRIHETLGYSSLHAFCTQHLGLSDGAAQRRISALFLSRDLPEVTQKIQDGSLTLSSVSALQTFFKNQRRLGVQTTSEEKRQVVARVEGLSRKETEKTLHQIEPEAIPQERGKIALNDRTLAKLQKLKAYWSHKLPESSFEEVLERLLDDALAVEDKRRFGGTSRTDRNDQKPIPTIHSAAESTDGARPAIPAPMRRQVWRQAQGRCQYNAPTGKRCDSRRYLEIDHIIPWARARRHELSNLRLLCRAHNQART
jgi:hypothetical protein